MGHKHDYSHPEAFCKFHKVVVADVVGAVDVDIAVAVVVVVAAAAAAAAAAAVVVVVAAVAAAVEEACPALDRKLQYLGPLTPRWEETSFDRSLPYVDHEAAM